MYKWFKTILVLGIMLLIPYWVFSNTGTQLSLNKFIYLWQNKHTVDWYSMIFEKHGFAIVCTISLWINTLIACYIIPIMSWIKAH